MKRINLALVLSLDVPDGYVETVTAEILDDGRYSYCGHLLYRRGPDRPAGSHVDFELSDVLRHAEHVVTDRILDAIAKAT